MPREPSPEQLESPRFARTPDPSGCALKSEGGRRRAVAGGRKRSPAKPGLPRLALTFAESAAMLGVSDEFFARYVAHEVRFVRRGRKKLVSVRELERWLEESAAREAL